MKCITSPALDDIQIMSYIEGEADDTVVAHMRECPYCSERAEQWTLLQKDLKKRLHRVDCPTPMELGDYHLGFLPAPQALLVAQHVRGCPLCRREVARLDDFLAEPVATESFLGTARKLIARLIGDNPGESTPAFAALRGEAKGPMMFETDGIVITLDFQTDVSGQASILGQVAAADQDEWTGAKVELQRTGLVEQTASIDDLGAFRFQEIHPGAIQIKMKSVSDTYIEIPNIDITV